MILPSDLKIQIPERKIVSPYAERVPIRLHPGQFEVFSNPARFRVVAAGRRWGKSTVSKAAIIDKAHLPRRKIWYVAPTYRMAKQIMWYDMLDTIPRRWMRRQPNETTMTLWLINGTTIELKGADSPDTLRGVGLHFIVLDEVQDMREEVWTKVLRPTLATTGGHAIFIGSPKGFNLLYKLWLLGQNETNRRNRRWHSWQFPTTTSPFVPLEEIEQARADMDEKSFRQEFMACHLPDTLVLLWNGRTKKISDVLVGDLLVHVTEEGKRVPTKVQAVGETGKKDICDVTLETGEVISASAHHRFKVHCEV
ncbi:terminase large subunit domain-containing protein [Methylocaldum szegediense]|uniref:terminase large subunit domain-containing protein n=1 Tax=Methylocaldum szegediense TaxID=73780 RepID=UPI00041A203A|nr:terminase family protein [Methylocaldum szegediense]